MITPCGILGKGDLVGCDISLNLMHNGLSTHQTQGGQDFILKSSSDVKVGQLVFSENVIKSFELNVLTWDFLPQIFRH